VRDWFEITPEYRQEIQDNMKLTKFGAQAVITYRKKRGGVPPWLKSTLITNIINGKRKKLPKEQAEYLPTLWNGAPEMVTNFTEELAEIRWELERTKETAV